MANPDNLRILRKGEKITADHYAAVTRAAKASQAGRGQHDSDGSSYVDKITEAPRIYVKPDSSYPPFSILQITGGTNTEDVQVYTVGVPTGSSSAILCGLEEYGCFSNTVAPARLFNNLMPLRVVVDSTQLPTVLQACGPVSGLAKVSKLGKGLICLSVPADDSAAGFKTINAIVAPGSGGAQIVQVTIGSVDCIDGTATGTVTDILCAGAEASIGDIVDLSDPLDLFAGNPLLVEGRTGIAVKMAHGGMYSSCVYKIINIGDLGANCG